MKCANCNGTKTRSRRNFTHGRNSKSTTTVICLSCGSTQMAVERKKRDFRRR